ncbi:MAG: family 78 glycoside hydrolase catalytic domain, partial [Bacteroidales bacterium]
TENNEFDGEKYDARLEMSGWDKSGFNDSNWKAVELVDVPSGKLTAQLNEPIRVTGHIKPVSVKPLKPGVYIFDMGQNMVGWASLRVKGKKGDKITMRFAELLKGDGGLYLENLRTAQVTDSYILKGNGIETWEPKFTYHGFRYVEVTGLKTAPDLSTIIGCIVNDDLATNGSFECSNQTMNQLYKNATWGIRGNYRSFPTDCPQRDERMGWLGDRATGCRGESYVFNNAGLYRKWLGDIRDEQNNEGSIPDVCPAYWYIFHDNVTWDGTSIMISEMLLDQFGNENVVAENYESMKKWFLYMYNKYARDGIMPQDSYGDWCMPPEDLTLIHSKDPSRITEAGLLGTSFYYHDACVMQRFAKMLDKQEDAQEFSKIAEEMKAGYNSHFFISKMNYYSNNTVTANILSLAFGLVPDDKKQAVFDNLVAKIENENEAKLSVGLIGIMYLQRILTEYGRPDLALHFATSTEYPSWGYMVKNGATTIWELWNGNTANPAMNSGNHVMLLGDLVIWMYENVGGIKPVEPGFKSIMMKPLIGNEITFAKALHKSPYGNIVSDWRFENSNYCWNIEIPVNTKATVYIPANNADAVLEGSQKASTAAGVRLLEMKDGFAIYEVLSGVYHFVSPNIQIAKPDYTVSPQVKVSPKDSVSATNIRVEMNSGDKDTEIRYTLDDTNPTADSKLYKTPLELSKHSVLQARSFKNGMKPGYVTRRIYDVYDRKLNGLNYEYFDGKWDKLPDYNALKPEKTGWVNGFVLSDIKTKEDYWGIRFKGFIEILQDGIYTFSTTSDDGSRLFVNGVKVVENDGIQAAFTVFGKIELKKGKYPIILDYFEGNYDEILKVEIDGPGIVRQALPVSMLFFE